MKTPTETLSEFCASLSLSKIPGEIVDHAKLCILDGLGCALFGAGLDCGQILGSYVRDVGGRAEASLWGMLGKVPAANAALVNGTLVHSFELDDLHKSSILHPTSVALPAAIAIAQSRGSTSGANVIAAYIGGTEAGIRAGNCVGVKQLSDGFHPTGTLGPIAAAGAAGNLLGLSAEQMLHALSIGATQAAGLMSAQFESMVKRVHAGRAAQSGVMAAELAQRGLTGIDTVFENDYGGFCKTFGGPDANIDLLTDGLGEEFETANIGFKCYAACGSTHTTIDAIKELRNEHKITADDVERIDVEATTVTKLHVGFPYEPGSLTSAQMNLPYAAAVTLLDGEAFIDQYSQANTHNLDVIALAKRVSVTPAADLDAQGGPGRHTVRIIVSTKDGRNLKAERTHAKGSPADPLTRNEVIEKFYRLAETRIGSDGASNLYDCVMDLENKPDIKSLTGLL
jgi:2-methylcitrate dehydratase PrpD